MIADAAGNNETEGAEVRAEVEGEAVAGDAAGDVDANGGKFLGGFGCGPDAGEAGQAAGGDAAGGGGADEDFLESAHVIHRAEFEAAGARRQKSRAGAGAEIENGIADELAGTMEGDIAAAVALRQLDAARGQGGAAEQHVFGVGVAAERDHGGMLEQQQGVGNGAGLAAAHQRFLHLLGRGISYATEMGHAEASVGWQRATGTWQLGFRR